jgi:cytochrome c peroxidase
MRASLRGIKLARAGGFGLALLLAASSEAVPAATVEVEVLARFDGTPLAFDALTNVTAAGQRVSVTRLDFLLANFALRRADGAWVAPTNGFAYVSGREGRTRFRLERLPPARYDRVRFLVGLPPEINHADPARHPPGHPLNPTINGLHWNWQGGYVFLAIEGNWVDEDRAPAVSGYSWHVATDRLRMTVELPVALDLAADHELRLALNVDRIFSGSHVITLTDDSTATHSRAADKLAGQLRDNIERAFAVDACSTNAQPPRHSLASLGGRGVVRERPATPRTPLVASNATPYRFTFPRFFPQPALPPDNPMTEEGVELGRHLFHDPRLSVNNRQSCASCHQADAAFADAGQRFSVGAEGQPGTRNAMPLLNLAWKSSFFWDGRAPSLREQVLMPIQNPVEMHETLANVVAKLATAAEYPARFERAFGSREIAADRLARALEQFLLTQTAHDSKFDRALRGEAALTDEERRGFELFHTEYDPRREQFGADCFHCHGGPLFQSQSFANNGLDATFSDPGRFAVTKQDGDQGKFAVPSLRNVALTAPYMHDGRFRTLEEAVAHYAGGVKRSATLDPNLAKHPDGGVPLNAADQRALVAFLRTLTDERFAANRDKLVQTP